MITGVPKLFLSSHSLWVEIFNVLIGLQVRNYLTHFT